MKLNKLADRTISILGLILFGTLTGFSLFFTVYFSTSYEEIPYEKGDIFPMVLAVCALGLFCMEWISRWILKEKDKQVNGYKYYWLRYFFIPCVSVFSG